MSVSCIAAEVLRLPLELRELFDHFQTIDFEEIIGIGDKDKGPKVLQQITAELKKVGLPASQVATVQNLTRNALTFVDTIINDVKETIATMRSLVLGIPEKLLGCLATDDFLNALMDLAQDSKAQIEQIFQQTAGKAKFALTVMAALTGTANTTTSTSPVTPVAPSSGAEAARFVSSTAMSTVGASSDDADADNSETVFVDLLGPVPRQGPRHPKGAPKHLPSRPPRNPPPPPPPPRIKMSTVLQAVGVVIVERAQELKDPGMALMTKVMTSLAPLREGIIDIFDRAKALVRTFVDAGIALGKLLGKLFRVDPSPASIEAFTTTAAGNVVSVLQELQGGFGNFSSAVQGFMPSVSDILASVAESIGSFLAPMIQALSKFVECAMVQVPSGLEALIKLVGKVGGGGGGGGGGRGSSGSSSKKSSSSSNKAAAPRSVASFLQEGDPLATSSAASAAPAGGGGADQLSCLARTLLPLGALVPGLYPQGDLKPVEAAVPDGDANEPFYVAWSSGGDTGGQRVFITLVKVARMLPEVFPLVTNAKDVVKLVSNLMKTIVPMVKAVVDKLSGGGSADGGSKPQQKMPTTSDLVKAKFQFIALMSKAVTFAKSLDTVAEGLLQNLGGGAAAVAGAVSSTIQLMVSGIKVIMKLLPGRMPSAQASGGGGAAAEKKKSSPRTFLRCLGDRKLVPAAVVAASSTHAGEEHDDTMNLVPSIYFAVHGTVSLNAIDMVMLKLSLTLSMDLITVAVPLSLKMNLKRKVIAAILQPEVGMFKGQVDVAATIGLGPFTWTWDFPAVKWPGVALMLPSKCMEYKMGAPAPPPGGAPEPTEICPAETPFQPQHNPKNDPAARNVKGTGHCFPCYVQTDKDRNTEDVKCPYFPPRVAAAAGAGNVLDGSWVKKNWGKLAKQIMAYDPPATAMSNPTTGPYATGVRAGDHATGATKKQSQKPRLWMV
eukprot:g3676.t1